MTDLTLLETKKKRRSGVPTGNAGEYLVMGELLRRGFEAQLADRNTKDYDILCKWESGAFRPVQVKTVRAQPWFVSRKHFEKDLKEEMTVYVLLGPDVSTQPARFFIVKNDDIGQHAQYPDGWKASGFMKLKPIEQYENNWDALKQNR